MATIFTAAKKAAPKSESKSTKTKIIVTVNMGRKLAQLQENREAIKSLEASNEMLEGEIKPVAKDEYLKLVAQQGLRPESFVLQSAGTNILIIVQDKYLKMSEAKERALIDNGLGDVIEEKTVYSFDPVLLEKYEEQISEAISNMGGIPDEDKQRLIKADVIKSVKKGTIERIATFKNPALAYELIEPQMQIKNRE